MSFWSWIGLVDKNQLSKLQDDIQSLKEDNKSLLKQNAELMDMLSTNLGHHHEVIEHELDDCRNNINTNTELLRQSIDLLLLQIKEVQHTQQSINDNAVVNHKSLVDEIQLIIENEEKIQSAILKESEGIKEYIKGSYPMMVEQTVDRIRLIISECSNILNNLQEQVGVVSENVIKNGNDMSQKFVKHHEYINICNDNLRNLLKQVSEVKEDSVLIGDISDKLIVLSESLNSLWTIEKAIWIDSVLDDIDSMM